MKGARKRDCLTKFAIISFVRFDSQRAWVHGEHFTKHIAPRREKRRDNLKNGIVK